MKIGDRCFVHGYVDEIRKDTVIIKNKGGYFGTDPGEVIVAYNSAHPNWIPCSERLPEGWQWFYATCRSKVDNRENWVIEGLSTPWKLWGDLPPMVKEGDAEIIAWMPKELPEPYKGDTD